jgi:hypothetical protein
LPRPLVENANDCSLNFVVDTKITHGLVANSHSDQAAPPSLNGVTAPRNSHLPDNDTLPIKAKDPIISPRASRENKRRLVKSPEPREQKKASVIGLGEATTKNEDSKPSVDLAAIASNCTYLEEKASTLGATQIVAVGTFKSPEMPNKIFHLSVRNSDQKRQGSASLEQYLQSEQSEVLTSVHPFKVAIKLAKAVLQFHSTVWLNENWRLADLRVLVDQSEGPWDSDDMEIFLNSRLFATEDGISAIPSKTSSVDDTGRYQFRTEDYFGINNMTLFCLGVALLEIGHWKPLSKLRRDYDPDDILTARRVANRRTGLGSAYQDIVRKCLQCNFGVSTNLCEPDLQAAVYTDVVLPLETLVEKLEDLGL